MIKYFLVIIISLLTSSSTIFCDTNSDHTKKNIGESKSKFGEEEGVSSSSKGMKKIKKERLSSANIFITSWNPPTGLELYFGRGSTGTTNPTYSFNLNLGWARFFVKSNDIISDKYLYNSGIPYIVEIKPFDLASFLTSGSSFSLFVDRYEWLRNLTLIVSNRIFSSTQYLTSSMLWYYDFLSDAMEHKVFFPTSVTPTSESTLERKYPTLIDTSLGVSDRIHIYRSPKVAVGLMFFFEATLPKTRDVVKNYTDLPPQGQIHLSKFTPSNRFTFATLGGLFFKYKYSPLEIYSEIVYQRRQGDFDAWTVGMSQNTLLARVGTLINKQLDIHLLYYMINWELEILTEQSNVHMINLGTELIGFGRRLEWLGLGFDVFYQYFKQNRVKPNAYEGKISGISLIGSFNFYPLAFYGKNHTLKLSLIYGLFKLHQTGNGIPIPGVTVNVNEEVDWNYALYFRVSYKF